MLNKTATPVAQTYQKLHEGKTMLIKVGGKEMEGEKPAQLAADIMKFVQNGVRFILVFGGGPQIDAHWSTKHTMPRKMKDGVGVTTMEVLFDAVIPAYEEITAKLRALLPGICIVPPADVVCVQDPWHGFVGEVKEVKNFAPHRHPVSAVGFMGSEWHSGHPLNVNADSLANALVQQFHGQIDEVILLTETGGILDTEDKVRPLILSEYIDRILSGEYAGIQVDGGMKHKVGQIKGMLDHVDKVALINGASLKKELETWRGGGTLFVQSDALELGPLNPASEPIFDQVYAENEAAGLFRKRSLQEMEEVKAHHTIFTVGGSPLAGFSLVPTDQKWAEFGVFWAGFKYNGLGEKLLAAAKEQAAASNQAVYALSKPGMVDYFGKGGFNHHKSLREAAQTPLWAAMPESLKSYDTTNRNPELFTYVPPNVLL